MLHKSNLTITIALFHLMVAVSCNHHDSKLKLENSVVSTTIPDTTFMYTRAIEDYIQASYQTGLIDFDTLFLINRKNNLADDFPQIQLPSTIQHKNIALLDTNTLANWNVSKPDKLTVNLLGWIDFNKAEFIFVTFFKGMEHQYDYQIMYQIDASKQPHVAKTSWTYFAYKRKQHERKY